MDEKERKKLVEKRKKEQEEKELQYDINKDLKIEFRKKEIEETRQQFESKYSEKAIIFFGTLLISYFFIFGSKFMFMVFFGGVLELIGINIDWVDPVLHVLIWGGAVISAVKDRSILDDILDRLL